MQLKSIELKGFKSFHNKTKIIFPIDGLVSIVGPNGSGKSNVLDAFRWVLGEQSAKTLRGEKMEDVIFSGTQYKKPMNMCEVEILFDNSDRTLNIDYEEVSIRRKAYRSGESTFYLNNKVCRLKDVRELFMDSGIGREGYSIIGQGKVDEIINAGSVERRKIFEEACGITRYRYKKEENERKLERVKENLERIEDVYTEIERRVLPLEREKQKAEEYFALKAELKRSELNLIWRETEGILDALEEDGKQVAVLEEQQKQAERAEELLSERREDILDKIEQRTLLIRNMETENQTLFQTQKELESHILRNQELISSIYTQEEYRKKEAEHLKNEIERLEREKHEQYTVLQDKKNEREQKKKALTELSEEESSFSAEVRRLEVALSEKNKLMLEARNEKSRAEFKLENVQEQILQERASEEKIQLNFTTLEQQKQETLSFIKQEKEQLKDLLRKKQAKESDLLLCRKEAWEIQKKLDEVTKCCHEKSVEQSTLQSKVKMLTGMEQDYEGMPMAIKGIMKDSRMKGVHDVIANLFQTDEKYEVAIEAALGAAINNIVVDDNFVAKEAISFLKKKKLGKVTMLPLENLKPSKPDLSGELFADTVVKTNEKYRIAASYLLGRTILCSDIDSAIATSKKYHFRYKVVTLDGDIFNAGGSVTGGYRSAQSNLLTNRRVRREHEQKLREISSEYAKIKAEQQKLLNLQEEQKMLIGTIEKEIEQLKIQLDEKNLILQDKNREEQAIQTKIRENLSLQEDSKEKLMQLARKEEDYRNLIDGCNLQIEQLNREIEEKNRQREQESEKHREQNRSLEELRTAVTVLNAETEGIEHALKIQSDNLWALQRQVEDRNNRQEDNRNRIEQLQREEQQICLEIDKIAEEKELLVKNLAAQTEELAEEKKLRDALDVEKKQLEADKPEKLKQIFELEKRLNKNRLIIDNYNSKLQEEYMLEMEDIKEFVDESANTKKSYIQDIRRKIEGLGNVNLNAIEEYAKVKERYEFYREQKQDLTEALSTTEHIIKELKKTMAQEFKEEFAQINLCFQETFRELFGKGGAAELVLADENNLLSSDIEIKAQPPGKRLKSIAAMSGGEKALTAIGIVFAILMRRPSPFCFLDEIDAPLDDANVYRFNEFLQHMRKDTQFVTITHRRGTMKSSKYIYGVTMEEKGISKLLSMELEQAGDFIEE